jgi:hypothetical protein
MQQQLEEILEDFVDRFLYVLQRTKLGTLSNETTMTIFLRKIVEEYIDVLNLMCSGDISNFPFVDICNLCRNYSSRAKQGKWIRGTFSRVTKSVVGGVTRVDLVNLLDYLKTEILGTLSSQLNTIKIKKKQEEENATLTIFCHQCRKMHPPREYPLNNVLCVIFVEDHDTESFPSLSRLKYIYKGGNETIGPSFQADPKRPW